MTSTRRSTSARTTARIARRHVSLPLVFLEEVAPDIASMEELQVSLAVFRMVAELEGEETPIAERMILRDAPLRRSLRRDGIAGDADDRIQQGIDLAVGRGTLLRFAAVRGTRETLWYYLNTPVNRATVASMQRGALAPPAIVWEGQSPPAIAVDQPNAFRMYEQNIGPLTPLIADQISRAVEEYPGDWIEDAIAEAVTYNRRSWRYILRILENWTATGRRESDVAGNS
ncbi:MAG TPA: DnaD domain protein [Thermomicrobiales bacterium]|nr:DnaD domain protein [Thermomicrobiales bacterium]